MNGTTDERASAPSSRVPRGGWLAIGLILAAMALLSIYSNVQKSRRGTIEKVTITPAVSVSPAPSPAQP